MKEFLFVFRTDWNGLPEATPEQAQARTKTWMDWIGGIAAQNKLVSNGNRLHTHGRTVKADEVITDGPYSEMKEFIGGYTLVRAGSYDEAVALAKGCPVLNTGGSVEVREINPM